MKTKKEARKEFDAVKTFRDIKSKISADIQGMSFEQFKAYLAQHKLQPPA